MEESERERVRIQGWEREIGLGESERERRVRIQGWERDGERQVWGRVRERSRLPKIKNIEKQNLLYGCFKNNPHKR